MLVIGVLLGGITIEAIHIFRDKHRHEVFEQRQRCKSLADAYVKANWSELESYTTLDRADFSQSRNSCIAAIHATILRNSNEEFVIVDVLSGEKVYAGWCSGNETSKSYCGNGRNFSLQNECDKSFEKSLGSFWW